ncbi:MAG: methyltransferase domain-containing protein [Verrucomicrobiales bacterium]|nr:methyltransferase domain-containing protein [Verrucomicrobiales bacterium]
MNSQGRAPRDAATAMAEAQRIAFAPVVFQACRVMRENGILERVRHAGKAGLTVEEAARATGLPRYGVKVLMESGLGAGVFELAGGRYVLTPLGMVLLRDPMTRVNMDFIHDVCYRGLFDLDRAIVEGRPAGLESHGDWSTVYEALSSLPERVQKSWFAFDHYYSDRAFPAALPLVFAGRPRRLADVGGNTGKWAALCAAHDPEVAITIVDLPQQLEFARRTVEGLGLVSRVALHGCDLLDPNSALPPGQDAVWMSQFLDCFSEEQIVSILRRARGALAPGGAVFVLELFWDRQPNEAAAFCLQQTSLYFTCIANGNSQMYHSSDFRRCLDAAGLAIDQQWDGVGLYHTLLKCRAV